MREVISMRSGRGLLVIGVLLGSIATGPLAWGGDRGCSGADLRRVRVPLDHDHPGSGRFDLTYRLREGTRPGGPTIIVIPGGPGATPIEDDPNGLTGAIPPDYRVVLTDPRGAGCNDDPRLADDRDFTSEFLARDALAIVAALQDEAGGAPLDYVLYGQSYGTLVATMAAGMAAERPVATPRALVLEGTLGHSFANYAEYFAPFRTEWRLVRDALPFAWQAAFRGRNFPAPLPHSTSAWAFLVESDLMTGYRPDGDHELEWQLSPAGRMALLASVGYFTRTLRARTEADAPPVSRLVRVISCRELFGEFYPLREFHNGDLVVSGENECSAGEGLSHPFDVADWPVTVPVVYIQGEHDPATTPAQARYHFDHQPRAPRYFVSVDRAAHAVLDMTLDVGDCPARLWDAIALDLDRLAAAVKRCDALEMRAHVRLEYAAPERAGTMSNSLAFQ